MYADVLRYEKALEVALRACGVKATFETRGSTGDRLAELDIVGWESGQPVLSQLNLTRIAAIMESELS